MSLILRVSFFVTLLAVINADTEQRRAIAVLGPRNPQGTVAASVGGTIEFAETDRGVRITGSLTGMPAGKYGFHVHEIGDISSCDAAGAHFNPEGTTHGGRDHEVRHVGDLGNIAFSVSDVARVANIDITDNVLALRGANSILGRTLVLHAQEDDLGLGGHMDSLTTGNAGARVACGVIGIVSPVTPWNSAVTSSPSFLLFIVAGMFAYLTM